ncbi:hypothetical protein [Coleofasciculus sp.]|uniref:hypothetical protein n=1 Tax=Coleofasciculus sp. TaxID=3100458 RepID=UPI003A224BAB
MTDTLDSMSNSQKPAIDDILEQASQLSPEEKAQLVERLLKVQGLSVVFGNSQVHADLVVQLNNAPGEYLAEVLRAIASRIDLDKK